MNRDRILMGVLGIHLTVAFVHGGTHALVSVTLPAWQNVLVLATVFVGPIVGVALVRRGHPLGLGLFTVTMVGGLVLGSVLHFLVENPDHIHVVPANQWRYAFQLSAVGVAITGTLGTVAGVWAWNARASPH